MDGTILIADDDRTIRTVLTQALTRAGCKVHATSSLVTLMRWVEEGRGDLVISDVIMPDGNGLEMLPKISEARPGLPMIVISAQNTIMTAIQATEREAYDYLPKPFDLPDLMKRVSSALKTKPSSARTPPSERLSISGAELPMVGRTPVMQELYRLVAHVMNTEIPVLIAGESGTGKSLLARAFHDYSDRSALPYLVVKGSELLQDEALKTLAAKAQGGTIVFDEVGDFSPEAQLQMVRFLDQHFDRPVRILAISQTNLIAAMEAGQFRQDLYYRVAGATLAVPALRERVDDIALLSEHFLAHHAGMQTADFEAQALDLLRAYSWPGNVRQLENTIHRLSMTSRDGVIHASDVELVLETQPASEGLGEKPGGKLSASVGKHLKRYFDLHGDLLPPPGLYQRILREVEQPMIELALDATGGNQAKCADLLGINRNTLRKKIAELDIRVTRRRKLM